ncbi:hypothetical protein QBC37DRAFT_380754 [Rhypophila decipiens]|uniref:Uncharacterized protein n=1 Tax=Rhypophila decipiens TaxID=261697 RepID=A0AAN6XTT6_9PEZI|nr:hypothetical protein QBC37DRAFT_380754 [Rhypophila decipiens]
MAKKRLKWPQTTDFTKETSAEVRIVELPADEYYGEAYQDVQDRVPNIDQAVQDVGWKARRGLEESIRDLFRGAVAAR